MTQDQKHYYAFISHSSVDEKTALWLRDQLESYHIPSAVQHACNVSKRLKPVFCYQTDLAGSELQHALKQSLDDSQFLIVLCSPTSAKSKYVNEEIKYFRQIGKSDKIIPFIVDGEPYASLQGDVAHECFPPAIIDLKEEGKELRGVNFIDSKRKLGSKKAAVVNVIATMLGIRFDALWDRYKRRQTRIRVIIGIVLAFILLEIFSLWNFYRPTYKYYADYVDRWGAPEGVVELTKEEQLHRRRMWMFEYRRIPWGEPNYYSWRVSKVYYVSADKVPQEVEDTEMTNRYSIQEIEYYKTTGQVYRVNYSDSKRNVVLRHVLTERKGVPASVADFVDAQEQHGGVFLNANLTSMVIGQMDKSQAKSKIVRFVYTRNADGYITRVTFHSNNDYELKLSATADMDGIYGIHFTLDSLGRPLKIEYLGEEYAKTVDKNGIAGRRYEYDKYGNISQTIYIGINGNPIMNEMQCAIVKEVPDQYGNIVEEMYFDEKGEPCLISKGFASAKFKYDPSGIPIEEAYFGLDGKPTMSNEGMAKVQISYHNRDRSTEIAFLDTLDHYCFNNEGVCRVKERYDMYGNVSEICFFDANNTLCLSGWGVAKQQFQYDSQGNVVGCTFLGTDNNPCLCVDGYSKIVSEYNEKGYLSKLSYFDTNDNLCLNEKRIAIEEFWYDERGNLTDRLYYGTDQKFKMSTEGYAICMYEYDKFGKETTTYYDTNVHRVYPELSNDR